MSTFNRFCAKAQETAVRVGGKMGEMGDSAALALKMKRVQIRMDEQYEKLGRLTYRELHGGEELSDEKQAIVDAISALGEERAALAGVKRKAKKQEKK